MINSIINNDYNLPNIAEFKINEIKETIKYILNKNKINIKEILKIKNPNWQVLLKIEEDNEKINKLISIISHMNSVLHSIESRKSYEYAIVNITNYYSKLEQNQNLYNLYKKVQNNNLSDEQIQAINKSIIKFEQSGVNLNNMQRGKLKIIFKELAQLSNKFENNILDASMNWLYISNNKNEFKGISKHILKLAENKAKEKNINLKYALGIDLPTYLSILQQSDNRKLRKIFYKAYCTKASKEADNKKFNNDKIIEKILKLRIEQSKILGFNNYAEYSLYTKMAKNPQQVLTLMYKLLKKLLPKAAIEITEISNFAKKNGFINKLQPWDVLYFSEKLKKSKFNFTEEEIQEYFPLKKVLDGLFKILKYIYDLDVKENIVYKKYIDNQQNFDFYKNNLYIGSIICDLFARDNKRSGAWMNNYSSAYVNSNGLKQYPIAFVTCNFLNKSKNNINLTHNDVITLFHEFGHALHHILSKVAIPSISGVNGVEWDAIELPSQFMENFCWCKEGLELISQSKNGKKLSNNQINQIIDSRYFNSALAMVKQIKLSIFDINIHYKKLITTYEIQKELKDIRSKINIIKIPNYNKFQNSFSHIFAGGYASGYYSYIWAKILSSDIFSRFKKYGILNNKIGDNLLKNIISKGSSRNTIDNFIKFMGRKPNEKELLKNMGII